LRVPAGGTCSGAPCWSATGTSGFRYADPTLANDGVQHIRLKAGTTKGQLMVSGKGTGLGFAELEPLLPFDQSPTVTVQMTNSDGRCWTADYSAPALSNERTGFLDSGD
jgi:hypothetical protein